MVDRRSFLRLLGLGAVVATGSCGDPEAPTTSPVTETVTPTTMGPPVPPDWVALRGQLGGGLVLPGDAGYDLARRSFNTLFDGRQPAAVASCHRTEDVQTCVEVARKARMPIAARSGGHSYAGHSTPEGGLVVDLARLSVVDVRADGTVEVGAGTILTDVYARLAAAGRCLPAGTCPTVGIAGLTLGGGLGVLNRKFGLTCDRLVSARVVVADSRCLTASAESEPDLFWALRGGGGGNVGIVTSFTFATEPAPDLVVFSLRFPPGSTSEVLGAWQDWLTDAPDELWSNCVISAGSPPSCRVGGCFAGPVATVDSLVNGLLRAVGARPTTRVVQSMGYLDAMRYFAGCSQLNESQCRLDSAGGQLGRASFVASSRMLPRRVDPATVVALLAGRTGMDLLVDSLGGAVSRVAPDATAFPHRMALASAQIYADASGGQQRAAQAVAEVRDGLGVLTGNTGYVNYIDPGLKDWATAYYGANLPRLRGIVRRYDPDAVLAFSQSVSKI